MVLLTAATKPQLQSDRRKEKTKYYHKKKPQLTQYLYGQCSEDLPFPCVPCSWPVSSGILGCNPARSPDVAAMCAAGLSLVELPVLMILHQVSHSALTTTTNKQLLTPYKQKTDTELE
jgi:hypothetical protein